MTGNPLRDQALSSVATLVLALSALVVFTSTAGAATTRHMGGGPLARTASPTGDCDNDGDNPLGVEFEECSPAPAEPGKLFTPAEKAQTKEQADNWNKSFLKTCGTGPLDPLTYLAFLAYSQACIASASWLIHLDGLVADPPIPSVSTVALPAVQLATANKRRCPYATAKCRRGRAVALAYGYAFNQANAAAGALVTTLDRLSATPSGPESIYGTGPGSAPLYSRRTQDAAVRLYMGLLAAWSDRVNAARTKFVDFLDRLGGKARKAAKRMPPALPSRVLWRTYHKMNVFEVAQLFSDLLAQNVPQARPTGQLALQLQAGLQTFDQDLYNIYVASRASGKAGTRKLDAAAKKFKHDADTFASIPGLAAYAPNAPLSAQLFGFAVEGLTGNKPAPVAAP